MNGKNVLNLDSINIGNLEEIADVNTGVGSPMQINVNDILEDANQPRFEFPEHEMKQLTKSISESGVKTPISVRKHPEIKDKFIINHGHRRYRASIGAGKSTVPAFIDEVYTDYDQVMENKERLGHSPYEIACFIQKKISEGEKKGVIADKLNETPVYISNHLALIDMPKCIEKAYRNGCTSPKTIYELRTLHKKFPTEIEKWVGGKLAGGEDITRTNVKEIGVELKLKDENDKKLDKIFSNSKEKNENIVDDKTLDIFNNQEPKAQEEAPAKPKAQEQTPVELQTQEEAPVELQTQEEAPAKPKAQEEAPVELQTQEEAPVELQTQEQTPVELQTQEQTPVELQTQEEAPVELQTQEEAPVELQTQEEAPVELQTQEEAPVELQTQEQTPAKPKAQEQAPVEQVVVYISYKDKEGYIVNKKPSAKNKVIINIENVELEVNCTLVELEYIGQ